MFETVKICFKLCMYMCVRAYLCVCKHDEYVPCEAVIIQITKKCVERVLINL